jgi:hypothetical protein
MTEEQTANLLTSFFLAAAQCVAVGFGIVVSLSQWRHDRMKEDLIRKGKRVAVRAKAMGIPRETMLKLQSGDCAEWELLARGAFPNQGVSGASQSGRLLLSDPSVQKTIKGYAQLGAGVKFISIVKNEMENLRSDIRKSYILIVVTTTYFLIGSLFSYEMASSLLIKRVVIMIGAALSIATIVFVLRVIWGDIKPLPEIWPDASKIGREASE